jgi:cell division GTPase FtsZ
MTISPHAHLYVFFIFFSQPFKIPIMGVGGGGNNMVIFLLCKNILTKNCVGFKATFGY